MIHDAKTSRAVGVWVDAETKQPIRWVRFYNDATHEYEAFRSDPEIAKQAGVPLRLLLYRGRARLVFMQTGVRPPKPVIRPVADDPEVTRLLHTLPRPNRPDNIDHGVPLCDEPLCRRPAAFEVADEQEVSPSVGPDGTRYERAAVPAFRRYCPWHYRRPTFTSTRGVTREVEVVFGRPQ